MSAEFTTAARAAILEAANHRCIGCGAATPLTTQHRRARGMGGSNVTELGQAINGVCLCGSGTTGCHGWTEHHPREAALLGWRLANGDHWSTPWWHRSYGWVRWILDDGDPMIQWVMSDELDHPAERELVLVAFQLWVAERVA